MGTALRASGLEDVIAADTLLSHVDGHAGRLVIAGFDVEDLAPRSDPAAAAVLLWSAAGLSPPSDLEPQLGGARVEAFARLGRAGDALAAPDAMDALRAAVAYHPATGDELADAIALTSAIAVIASAWARRQAGLDPVPPDPGLGPTADTLRMIAGREAPQALVRALSTYLVTVSDHGMNASTFAARVVCSTGSDAVSAIVAAIGALKGPLHGGAPGPVLDMLDQIGRPEEARPWLEAELTAGRRIMGMGHRVYRVRDPRAAVLEAEVRRLESTSDRATPRLALARAVEHTAGALLAERHPGRALCANVEFYTAVLLEVVGLPRALFSATFAMGRVVGWLAHIAEQRRTGRLIRPSSRYVGPLPATQNT
jgi:citrate synthase